MFYFLIVYFLLYNLHYGGKNSNLEIRVGLINLEGGSTWDMNFFGLSYVIDSGGDMKELEVNTEEKKPPSEFASLVSYLSAKARPRSTWKALSTSTADCSTILRY
jgi:hypothetical protein